MFNFRIFFSVMLVIGMPIEIDFKTSRDSGFRKPDWVPKIPKNPEIIGKIVPR